MSKLREAAQAVVADWNDPMRSVEDMEQAIDRLRAALAVPETAEPVAWQRRYITPTGPSGWLDCGSEHDWHDVPAEDVDHYVNRSDCEVRPLYAHPPRYVGDARKHVICICPDCTTNNYREWRDAALGALEICMILNDANRNDPERAMSDLMAWGPRDEWRPASEPPDNQRTVILWCKRTRRCYTGWHDGHIWHSLAPDITHWRDVTPPGQEGKG